MSKFDIVAERRGRAHEGLFGNSQFERFVKPLGVMALGSVGIEAWFILRKFLLWCWGNMVEWLCKVEGCESMLLSSREKAGGERTRINEEGEGGCSAGELRG